MEEHEEYDTLSELLEDLDEFPPASVERSDALVSEDGSQNTSTLVDNSNAQVEQATVTHIAEVDSDSNVVQLEARSEAGPSLNSMNLSGYPGHVPPLRYVASFMDWNPFDITQSSHRLIL